MKLFDMLTRGDIKRIKDKDQLDLAKRVKELDNSLSIALEINDNYQRENKELKERINDLEGKCREAGRTMIELNLKWESTLEENKKLKKRAEEAEGETTIIKGIGQNSPEMKALRAEVGNLKADLARAKEDHQYDNMVHKKEVNDRK